MLLNRQALHRGGLRRVARLGVVPAQEEAVSDANVEAVVARMRERAGKGLLKYGVTTERADLSLVDWLTHLQEELMDACVYIERAKKELPK